MNIQNWLRLRIAVIKLAEKHKWWDCQVLENDTDAFLEYILPKTKSKAALKLAVELACMNHDKNIKASHYHLFRLPSVLEKQMHHFEIFESEGADSLVLFGKNI